jgi:hypothetical protein
MEIDRIRDVVWNFGASATCDYLLKGNWIQYVGCPNRITQGQIKILDVVVLEGYQPKKVRA